MWGTLAPRPPLACAFCLLALGCHVPPAAPPRPEAPAAAVLWEQGQTAMRQGRPEVAVACYRDSLAADPAFQRNHLSLAAALLEAGDDAQACDHLARYLAAQPSHLVVRTRHADLLLRLERRREARTEYERCVADAQSAGRPAWPQLIHCHARLMELAAADDDAYDLHLQRGIGLYLLAQDQSALDDAGGDLSAESLLCQAAGALSLAARERPGEARPCWYLHRVWSGLAQRQPAERWLRRADAAAPFSDLTATEQHGLRLACRDALAEGARR